MKLTAEDVIAAPYAYTASQWQIAHNVHQPYIAEISPMQYGNLSKRGKAQYDAKRTAEWDASAQCKQTWREAVIAAYDADHTVIGDACTEAYSTIRHELSERRERDHQANINARHAENRNVTPKVGDTVWSIMSGGYRAVVKVNAKSIVVETPFGPLKTHVGACQWLKHDDFMQAVRDGSPIGPIR